MKSIHVNCGFNKWRIGWEEDGCVRIVAIREPIELDLKFWDISLEEMEDIATMFNRLAVEWKQSIEADNARKAKV